MFIYTSGRVEQREIVSSMQYGCEYCKQLVKLIHEDELYVNQLQTLVLQWRRGGKGGGNAPQIIFCPPPPALWNICGNYNSLKCPRQN